MANIKISDLPPASTIDGTEQYPIVQSGVTKRFTIGAIYRPTADEIAAGVTIVNFAYPPYDIPRYGASPSASAATNTLAIRSAIDAARISGNLVTASIAGTYIVTASTIIALEGGNQLTAFTIYSNMHIDLSGATLKMSDNVSTDASPKAINMFATNAVLQNVSWRNTIMDMNGANNKISPGRPAVYNVSNNMAHISVSGTPGGVAAQISDCVIEDCWFINTSGVCCIVVAQSNTPGITLGSRWSIRNNLFLNNGLDTTDHTSIFAWADNVTCDGNSFVTPDALKATPLGGISAIEIHGSNHRLVNNLVVNYFLGFRVATNFSTGVVGSSIEDNIFYCRYYGVTFFREGASELENRSTRIHNNTFIFDNTSIVGGPDQKACISIATVYAIYDVSIRGNIAYGIDNAVGTAFVTVTPGIVAANKYGSIVVSDNYVRGLTFGAYVTTNATNGISYLEFTDNSWVDLTDVAGIFDFPIGIRVSANTAPVDVLKIEGNSCIDTRGGGAKCDYGIFLDRNFTTLIRGHNYASGMVTADYNETNIGVMNRRGRFNFATVASIAALVVPTEIDTVFVSGTTNITSVVTLGHEGQRVTFIFLGALTFTDGSNLKLAGNFITTTDDSITCFCDGTNWYEISRSVN